MTPDDKDAVLDLARSNLTPDELPADMEAVVARLEVAAIDPAPWPDLRALLKAYQEQRRALERLANKDNEFGSEVQTIADTALNQKGDER